MLACVHMTGSQSSAVPIAKLDVLLIVWEGFGTPFTNEHHITPVLSECREQYHTAAGTVALSLVFVDAS